MNKLAILILALICCGCTENEPPRVTIHSPLFNSNFLAGDTIDIIVQASDPDGIIDEVEIKLDETPITRLYDEPYSYSYIIADEQNGQHTIEVNVTDDQDGMNTASVKINIGSLPVVTTLQAIAIGGDSALIRGIAPGLEDEEGLEYGFYFGEGEDVYNSGTFFIPNAETANDTFTLVITGLEEITTYYYGTYASNEYGESYGEVATFRTLSVTKGEITDIDGNMYSTVKIGNQWWMAKNLAVTTYRDGSPISHVEDQSSWQKLSSEAYTWYDNDISYKDIYGALYNGYVVNTGKLCPAGWKVPTDDDWKMLEIYLGIPLNEIDSYTVRGTTEGGALKEEGTDHWNEPNQAATNEHGFSAMGAGVRDSDGSFLYEGAAAFFWTSTIYVGGQNYRRALRDGHGGIAYSADYWTRGESVRCIKE